jgi:hypothetical protein
MVNYFLQQKKTITLKHRIIQNPKQVKLISLAGLILGMEIKERHQ